MNTFPIPTVPLPDESLIGFVARACDDNGHPSVPHVLGLAGFKTLRARFLSVSNSVDLGHLSAFFGCSEEDLRHRFHLPIEVDGCLPKTFITYLGSPIRRFLREPALRRVSPTSLRQSPYHRAIWTIRPLSFCPESGEMLISHCPNPACGKPLAWNYAFGIKFCESCLDDDSCPTTDLRSFDQPKLLGDDLEVYRSIAGLLTPQTPRAAAIPSFFQSWNGWEIFDMVVMLAVFLSRRFGDRFHLTGPASFALPEWHQNFMIAARAVMGWPDSISEIVQLMKEKAASRSGYYGRNKELGPMADFGEGYGATPKARAAIESAIVTFYAGVGRSMPESIYQAPANQAHEMISYREVLKKHKVSSVFLTSLATHKDIEVVQTGYEKFAPTYFNEQQLVELLKTRKQLLPVDRLLVLTGLPMFVILGLIQSKHIRIAEGAIARFRDTSVHPSEIARLRASIEANATKLNATDNVAMTKMVMAAGGAGGGLLLTLVQRCLDGKIEYSLSKKPGKLAAKILLPSKFSSNIETILGTYNPTAPTPAKMSRLDVTMYLDVPTEDIDALIELGLLKAGYMVDGKSVRQFNETYLTTTTVARWLRISTQTVKRLMDEHGVRPARVARSPGRPTVYVWRRRDIEPLLGKRLRGTTTS
jgi:ribosomal protein L32